MNLKLTIVFQVLWILVSTQKAIYENIPNLISNEQSYKLDDEGVRSLQEKATSQRGKREISFFANTKTSYDVNSFWKWKQSWEHSLRCRQSRMQSSWVVLMALALWVAIILENGQQLNLLLRKMKPQLGE